MDRPRSTSGSLGIAVIGEDMGGVGRANAVRGVVYSFESHTMLEIRKLGPEGSGNVQDVYNGHFDYETIRQLDSLYYWLLDLIDLQTVSSQKVGGNGVFWACAARPKHPAPLFIEKVLQTDKTLLDVACGASQLVQLATQRGVKSFGIDYSYAALKTTSSEGSRTFTVTNGEALPFQNNQFDYVTNIGSLEHYEDMSHGLQEIARVLKPGGKAVILVPNTFSILHNVYMALKTGMPVDDGQPLQRYGTLFQWKSLITANGIEIQKTYKYERELPIIWKDLIWYFAHPKKLIYLFLTPFIPTNLASCFVFICTKGGE